MADEITIVQKLTYEKGGSKFQIPSTTINVDAAGTNWIHNVQSIGTGSHEAISVGDVSSAELFYFKNLDATNYVDIGTDNTGTFIPAIRVKAGKEGWIPCVSTNALYAKANTASVNLEYFLASQ